MHWMGGLSDTRWWPATAMPVSVARHSPIQIGGCGLCIWVLRVVFVLVLVRTCQWSIGAAPLALAGRIAYRRGLFADHVTVS